MESDWNTFRRCVPTWQDRYLNRLNTDIAHRLVAGEGTPADRFWTAHDRVREEARLLSSCFDGLSRSKMHVTLHLMINRGIIEREELSVFSDDLRHRLQPWSDEADIP